MSPMRELWLNIVHTSGARIYAMALGIFTLFLTARLLGPEGRGQVAAINTWAILFSTFAYLSLGQVALNRMAQDRERRHFGNLLGSLLFMTLVLSVGGWLVAVGLHLANPEGAFKGLPLLPLTVGFLALPFLIWEQYGSSLLMGLERVRIYNRYQVIGRTAAVVAVFATVGGLGLGIVGVLGANLLGQVIVAFGGLGLLLSVVRDKGLACRPDRAEIKALLSGGAKLHLNAIGTYLFTSANILILNHYHGAAETGHFQLATQLLGVMMIIPQAASMVIYGRVASTGPNEAWPMNRRLLIQAGECFRPAVTSSSGCCLGWSE
jgi:O-antigen/teichoic acid export membrane protein